MMIRGHVMSTWHLSRSLSRIFVGKRALFLSVTHHKVLQRTHIFGWSINLSRTSLCRRKSPLSWQKSAISTRHECDSVCCGLCCSMCSACLRKRALHLGKEPSLSIKEPYIFRPNPISLGNRTLFLSERVLYLSAKESSLSTEEGHFSAKTYLAAIETLERVWLQCDATCVECLLQQQRLSRSASLMQCVAVFDAAYVCAPYFHSHIHTHTHTHTHTHALRHESIACQTYVLHTNVNVFHVKHPWGHRASHIQRIWHESYLTYEWILSYTWVMYFIWMVHTLWSKNAIM